MTVTNGFVGELFPGADADTDLFGLHQVADVERAWTAAEPSGTRVVLTP
jgi:hypothetical protein